MQGKTHVGLGLAIGAVATVQGVGPEGWAWGALAIGAALPDLDGHEGAISTPGQWLPRIVPYPGFVDGLFGFVGRITGNLFSHRGVLHYPLVAVILFLVGWKWLAIGYASHLLADGLTKRGIPLLGPLSNDYIGLAPKFLRIRTGSWMEKLFSTVIGLWLFVFLIFHLMGG